MAENFISVLEYVCSAPYFWGSMGFTTALGMFIGAILYDGNLTQASKGGFTVLTFAGMLLWTTSVRLYHSSIINPTLAYSGVMTTLLVSLFWVLGLILGVWVLSLKRYR